MERQTEDHTVYEDRQAYVLYAWEGGRVMWKVRFLASGSSGNAALLSDGITTLLIDVGISSAKIIERISPKEIDAVWCLHQHGDHAKFLYPFISRYGTHCFGLKSTFDSVLGLDKVKYLLNPVEIGKMVKIGSLSVIPIELRHDVPCIGLYIRNQYKETLLWVSDTSEIPVDIEADVYVIEANYDEETLDERGQAGEVEIGVYGRLVSEWGHMSAQAASRYIQKNAKPDSVVILQHVSQSGNLNMDRIEEVMGRPVLITPAEFTWGIRCPF